MPPHCHEEVLKLVLEASASSSLLHWSLVLGPWSFIIGSNTFAICYRKFSHVAPPTHFRVLPGPGRNHWFCHWQRPGASNGFSEIENAGRAGGLCDWAGFGERSAGQRARGRSGTRGSRAD